ncbi:hydantoinase/oxoprolinase family protein [Planktomarina temperata]|nr:hydantoinase/oxoprolinase family protein [Planktomarina temperata]
MLRIAIDIGGTFTDVVAETDTGLVSAKVLTSAQNPETAALEGVSRVLRTLDKSHSDITDIVHGTTLATNALIERRGAKIAFITTQGFRDVLAMRNERRFEQYALDIELPEPLVPRPLRLGMPERILADGSVTIPLNDADIEAVAEELRSQAVEAVAIGFLHSYKNPAHEVYVADRLRHLLGDDVTICLSSQVAGEIREYERFSTVCANAYVRPLMSRYVGRLLAQSRGQGFDGSFLMMLSDGALTTVEQAMRFPIRLVEGGPAGGVALAAHVAREVGSNKTLSLDIGGTTAKICFIENGTPKTNRRFEVARAWRDVKGSGLPVKVPTVELVEIGAGGGSIATVDALGRLKVGPKSAGSEPGPAAYNRGGQDATITDAHLTVANISAGGFAGGIIELDTSLAPKAIAKHIQIPLGMDGVEPAAAGIIELADETMANAARVHGIELGLDISSFDLLVSGGGGGLHGARIAEKLGIKRIIVPQNAGVGSAVGFLRSPVAFESAISVVEALDSIDVRALAERIDATQSYVEGIVAEAVPVGKIMITIKAELRYQGQGLDILLPVPNGFVDAFDTLSAEFARRYQALVGFTLKDIPIELVSITVSAREVSEQAVPVTICHASKPPPINQRLIYDLNAQGQIPYHVIERSAMDEHAHAGPAVVPEAQTTTLVRPGWSVRKDTQGHLIMERETP